jgi:hypothetical protein
MSTKEFEPSPSRQAVHHPIWLLLGFWISFGIAIAAVVRRLLALLRPATSGPPQMATLDRTFSSHTALTVAHIVPAAVFVVLAAVVLFRRSTSRWLEQSFFLLGVITGITAYIMSSFAIGGWVERSAVLVFDTWFLFSLVRAYCYKETALRREWMTRAVAVLLGIATTRPVMGIFFATSAVTHLKPNQFFGFAFWIGFSINALAVEIWLRSKRRREMRTWQPSIQVPALLDQRASQSSRER